MTTYGEVDEMSELVRSTASSSSRDPDSDSDGDSDGGASESTHVQTCLCSVLAVHGKLTPSILRDRLERGHGHTLTSHELRGYVDALVEAGFVAVYNGQIRVTEVTEDCEHIDQNSND